MTVPHPQSIDPTRWRECEAWQRGVDLYNRGSLWEAHESWERVWRAPFDADQRLFLQGLIQCAASALKLAEGQPVGAARLAEKGLARLDDVSTRITARYMGLDHRAFAAEFRTFVALRDAHGRVPPRMRLS